MPRINLLPWREELRQKRKKDFLMALGGAVLIAGFITLATKLTVKQWIQNQESRNTVLKTEITELDRQIDQILGLENQKERLLARMDIIEQLQRSRPEIVHLFDEVTRQLPEGVYLTGMKQNGSTVEIKGIAQSSTRVSALMRQIDASDWLTDPDVVKVETTEKGPARQAEFVVNLKQIRDDDAVDLEDGG